MQKIKEFAPNWDLFLSFASALRGVFHSGRGLPGRGPLQELGDGSATE